jgi:hypothetical protein
MAGITHYWEGTKLFITSDSGTTGCDLIGPKGDMGVRGPQGIPGIGGSGGGGTGADGVSPTITVTRIAGGHRITITDVNGTQYFDVMDGSSGSVDLGDYYNKDQVDAAITDAINNIEVPDSTPIATNATVGTVKPDGVSIYISADGTITAVGQGAEVQEVYVGTEEPADPNILFWLNPDDGTAAVAASTDYVNSVVGDFSEALDTINGEDV